MLIKIFNLILLASLTFSYPSHAVEDLLINHIDPIETDAQLSLAQLIRETTEKYPDISRLNALEQQSKALQQRGKQWLANPASINLNYRNDSVGSHQGAYEFDGNIQLPLWNWGQRDAGLHLAQQAKYNIEAQSKLITLKVAGLIRAALWKIKLQDQHYKIVQHAYQVTQKFVTTIKKQVMLGDLSKIDLLRVENELLEKQTQLLHAEAEVMHARNAFNILTQNHSLPKNIQETQSTLTSLPSTHPELAAIDAIIAQKQAHVNWLKAQGSGQTNLSIGGNTERGTAGEATINSLTLAISIPFGGQAYNAPQIANAYRALTEAQISRQHLYRHLVSQLHEAKHNLEIKKAQATLNQTLEKNALAHLHMSTLSFEAGEINLLDFLRIQTRSQTATQQSQINALKLQRDIALYNQALGVLP